MLIEELYNKDVRDVYETSIVQQTAFWSELKTRLGLTCMAFDFKVNSKSIFPESDGGMITGDILVLITNIDRYHSYAYVPYGPELEPGENVQGIFLEELSEVIRPFLPKNCIMIRYDLSWQSYWAKEPEYYDDKKWLGPPQNSIQEIRFNFNTVNWNFRKAITNILPSNTLYIDLKKKEDDILRSMKPKTRYNIGLSKKKGVRVRVAGMESLDAWYKLYSETAARNRFHLHDIGYFRTFLCIDADTTLSPAEVKIIMAEKDNEPLAAMFLVVSGNRGTYLYGASSGLNKNLMGSYAVQWEAMKVSKQMGCTEYDMFGIAPKADPSHPMYGLFRFKTGFGGSIYHTLGCWDYPLDKEKYTIYSVVELNNRFHTN